MAHPCMRRKVSNVRAVSQRPGATRTGVKSSTRSVVLEQLALMIQLFQVSLYLSPKSEEWRRIRNKTVPITTSPRTQVETSERLSVSHQNLHFDFRTRGYWVSGLGHCSGAGHLLTKQLCDSPGLPIIRGRLGADPSALGRAHLWQAAMHSVHATISTCGCSEEFQVPGNEAAV
jgi:hypothetical protein